MNLSQEQITALEQMGFVKSKYWFKNYFASDKYRELQAPSGSIRIDEIFYPFNKIILELHCNSFAIDEILQDIAKLKEVGIV